MISIPHTFVSVSMQNMYGFYNYKSGVVVFIVLVIYGQFPWLKFNLGNASKWRNLININRHMH